VAAAIALLAAAPGHACKCVQTSSPLGELAEATAVFTGVVQSISDDGPNRVVTLLVSGWWKGVTSSSMEIETALDPEACGYLFAVGEAYLVYAYPGTASQQSQFTTTSCTRTVLIQDAGSDLAELGPPFPPP
jgi:hypothetical protein